jgi:class 3 adenylate cyclase
MHRRGIDEVGRDWDLCRGIIGHATIPICSSRLRPQTGLGRDNDRMPVEQTAVWVRLTIPYYVAASWGAGLVEVIVVSRRVQTLLFTDIVGSTDRLRELGDAAWAALGSASTV